MTEKDFRKLVTDLEILNTEKQELLNRLEQLKVNLTKNPHKHYQILDVVKGGSWAKGTMLNDTDEIDVIVVVEALDSIPFAIKNYYILNAIENDIIESYPNINKLSNITRNVSRNIISFEENNFKINLQICYQDNNFPYALREKQIMFVELANRDYTYFRNTMKIIKYYRDEQNINISGYILEIMLYYSLNEYFKDNRYEDYLNGFIKTIDEFIKGARIEVSPDIYQKLEVLPVNNNLKKPYTVLDVADPSNNLTDNINEITIGEYRKLKKALAKLIDNKVNVLNSSSVVVLNINPTPIKDTNEFSWSYKIENSELANNGGSYQNTEEELLSAMYKALYKGLRAIVDNNLNRKNIEVVCKKQNILKINNVSKENISRIKNIEAYIENNGLIIKYR